MRFPAQFTVFSVSVAGSRGLVVRQHRQSTRRVRLSVATATHAQSAALDIGNKTPPGI
jgi:hypothetical protein